MKKSWSGVNLLQQTCCRTRVETSRCLCRYMNIPYERGRHDFESITARDDNAFIKVQPQASPPSPHAALAPLRDDVPLTEPHTGRLSAGACADLGLWDTGTDLRTETHRTHPPSFRPSPSGLNRSWGPRVKITVPVNTENYSSRERPVPGSTSPLGYEHLRRDACTSVFPTSLDKALENIYTPEAHRSCTKLTPPLKPPLEKMADPVSQCFTLKRYNSGPELWQTVGPHWNRHQIRASYYVKKPFSFTSPCPKSGQIPLYSGVIGSENMDNIDIPEKDFTPLTVLRTVLPPDTPTAHRPTIPGYTGKALLVRPHTSATSQPSSILTHQAPWSSSTPPSHGRQAPLSKMIITAPLSNPFLQPKTPTPRIYS